MYKEEKHLLDRGKPGADNIITYLVRASEAVTKSIGNTITPKVLQHPKTGSKGLTESELYGNIFVSNFASHDTTAITLG